MTDSWSDFSSDAVEASRPSGPRCAVSRVLAALPVDAVKFVQEALDNDDITSAGIAKGLELRGYKVSQHTIARHRRNDCRCGK